MAPRESLGHGQVVAFAVVRNKRLVMWGARLAALELNSRAPRLVLQDFKEILKGLLGVILGDDIVAAGR